MLFIIWYYRYVIIIIIVSNVRAALIALLFLPGCIAFADLKMYCLVSKSDVI